MNHIAGLRRAFDAPTTPPACAAHGCDAPVATTGYGPGKPAAESVTREFCHGHARLVLAFRLWLKSPDFDRVRG